MVNFIMPFFDIRNNYFCNLIDNLNKWNNLVTTTLETVKIRRKLSFYRQLKDTLILMKANRKSFTFPHRRIPWNKSTTLPKLQYLLSQEVWQKEVLSTTLSMKRTILILCKKGLHQVELEQEPSIKGNNWFWRRKIRTSKEKAGHIPLFTSKLTLIIFKSPNIFFLF